ncbi:MAG: nucleoside-diphosphate sugar epimerase/dehydratase [Croceibacterium sp.]
MAFLEWATALARVQKRLFVLVIDLALLVLSVWVAYSLRINDWILWDNAIRKFLIGAVLIMVPTFSMAGVYSVIFRYVGIGMMGTIIRAFIIYGTLTTTLYLLVGIREVPRTLGVLQPIIFFILIAGSRITIRSLLVDLLGRNRFTGNTRNVMIYGAGDQGQRLAASLRSEPQLRVVGYLDDDTRLAGQSLDGLRVYDSRTLKACVTRMHISDILLALPNINQKRRTEIIELFNGLKVSVKTLPPVVDIVGGQVSFSDVRPVDVVDLLGRDQVKPHELLLGRTIVGKNVLVTGAGGSIGMELCRQIVSIGARKLVLFDVSEYGLYAIEGELLSHIKAHGLTGAEIVPVLGTITDGEQISRVLHQHGIDTVYHAAAYKHVPLVEQNPLVAIRNNVIGTLSTIEMAYRQNVSDFILVSTDKAVRPTNVMGATKRAAEQILQAYSQRPGHGRYSMVRFGNVLGSSGSVVPLFQQQIENGGPVTLTNREVSRYFMTIPEAASLVIQAGGQAKGGEVFLLDMGKPIKIIDLARTMIGLSGLTVRDADNRDGDIEIEEVGLRPGEKIHEELLLGNNPQKTQHPRIQMAIEGFLPWPQLEPLLNRLESVRSVPDALALLQEVVPEFEHRRDELVGAPIAGQGKLG